jgi:hypothetical protein
MEQRRLRLGDILDDYCPRERRITNHAVVAMIDDEVKQTRCTTCDADHEYKAARIPPQRRKRLEGGPGEASVPGRLRAQNDEAAGDDTPVDDDLESDPPHNGDGTGARHPEVHAEAAGDEELQGDDVSDEEPSGDMPPSGPGEDDGPVHRRLIRATLPRQEGQVPERKEPEFTIRQPGMRGPDGRKGPRHGRRPMRGGPPQGGGGSWQGQPRQGSGQPGNSRGGGGGPRPGAGPGNRAQGNRPGPPGGGRGNRQGPPPGGGRGGRKRGGR